MADKKTCNEKMVSGWHFKKCGRPTKFVCLIEQGDNLSGYTKVHGHRCGIHAKRYEKICEVK